MVFISVPLAKASCKASPASPGSGLGKQNTKANCNSVHSQGKEESEDFSPRHHKEPLLILLFIYVCFLSLCPLCLLSSPLLPLSLCLPLSPSLLQIFIKHLVCFTKKAMAPYSSTLAWKIPWMEEPGWLQSMRSLRVRHD